MRDDLELTRLLERWQAGEADALEAVISALHDRMRSMARARLADERPDHTLESTGLVAEAWMRLSGLERIEWGDREHFLAVTARIMRRVLIDHARRRGAARRGGDEVPVTLHDAHALAPSHDEGLLALGEALDRLATEHPRPARAIDLHHFAGWTQTEIAGALGVSQPTVARDLRFGRAWLAKALGPVEAAD